MHPSEKAAREVMKLNQYKGEPRRVIDTAFPGRELPAWAALMNKDFAVLVYENAPEAVVSTGNHDGRFR